MARRSSPHIFFTYHGLHRADARGISGHAIDATRRWGRRMWSHGDQVFRLDRRCVERARMAGVRIDQHEGVTVVLSPDGRVKTTFRNRNPRRIIR